MFATRIDHFRTPLPLADMHENQQNEPTYTIGVFSRALIGPFKRHDHVSLLISTIYLCNGGEMLGDRRLHERLSDTGTLDNLRRMCRWSQLALEVGEDQKTSGREHQESFDRNEETLGLKKAFEHPHLGAQKSIGRLFHQFAELPWPSGRKDVMWYDKAAECRKRLNALWSGIYEECLWRISECPMKRNVEEAIIAMAKNPTYLADLEEDRVGREAAVARIMDSSLPKEPAQFVEMQTSWGNGDDQSTPTRRKMTKAKTARNTADEQALEEALNEKLSIGASSKPQPQEPQALPPIHIRQDSFAVVHRMFPAYSNAEHKAMVRWTQFCATMVDVGFIATASGGSAVTLDDGAKSISFHKPHPEPTIEPITLQCCAKRMNKRFGLTMERFLLREKEG